MQASSYLFVLRGLAQLGRLMVNYPDKASPQYLQSVLAEANSQGHQRLSVSFSLFRTSGKETDLATPLGKKKVWKIRFFTLETYLAQNRPKLMMAPDVVEFGLFRFQFHALLRSVKPLFPRRSLKLAVLDCEYQASSTQGGGLLYVTF